MAERRLLEGIRVLDCGSWIAGPAALTIMADFGAEVIKIEPPKVGDNFRNRYLQGKNAFGEIYDYGWTVDSRNKRSLTLNLKSDEGQEIFRSLVKTADVVLTNMPLKARRNLKLTYEDIKAVKNDIIYASLTPFGEEGPHAENKGFDFASYWARSGIMDLLRKKGEVPRRNLSAQGDHPTATMMFGGIMMALFDRERTGEGRMVCANLMHNGIWSNADQVQAASTLDHYEHMPWRREEIYGMYGRMYHTKDDNWVMIDMIHQVKGGMERFYKVLGIDKELMDPKYGFDGEKFANEGAVADLLGEVVGQWNQKELVNECYANDVLLVYCNKVEEVKDDPQTIANNMLVEVDPEVYGVDRLVAAPITLSGAIKEIRRPAPKLGEHTDEILADMGFSAEKIAELKENGVV